MGASIATAYSVYLDKQGKLYSNSKFVDIDNILLYKNGLFLSLDGSNAMGDIGLVTKQDIVALEARVDGNTLILTDKLDTLVFEDMAALKANVNQVLTPSDLVNIITETPVTNLTLSTILERSSFSFTITNFNSSYTYYITNDIGTVTLDSSTGDITVTVDEVAYNASKEIKISAVDGNKLISFPNIINIDVVNIKYSSDSLLINDDLVANAAETNLI